MGCPDEPAGPRISRSGASWLKRLGPILAVVAACAAFLPTLRSGFVNWDDLKMFVENPHYQGLGWRQLRSAWTTYLLGEWMPATWMSYSADYALWGIEPFGYHLTNLLLHGGAALAVYALARRLLEAGFPSCGADDRRVGAVAAALVFGVHPLRAEPVAWVSARGTILGGLFLLLAALTYVAGAARSRGGVMPGPWRWGSVGLFALSLLSRSTGLVLPAVLLVLDVYPLRRLPGNPAQWLGAARPVLYEKVPFLVLSVLTVPAAVLARLGGTEALWTEPYDPTVGLAAALFGAMFYLRKTVFPGSLAPIYQTPSKDDLLLGAVLASGVVLVLVTGLLVALRRRWPAGLAAWVSYGVLLLPMSGIVPFGRLRGAVDRYSYVTCLAWAVLAGAGVAAGCRTWRRGGVRTPTAVVVAVLGATVLIGWGVLSWRQVQVWRDGLTLWTHAVAVTPDSPLARNQLGIALEGAGDLAGATAHYQRALEKWSTRPGLHGNLGRVLAAQGRLPEAAAHFREAIRLWPGFVDAYVSLGVVLAAQGEVEKAIEQYQAALRVDPDSPTGHYYFGLALEQAGRRAEAGGRYRRALELKPDYREAAAGLRRVGAP